jgi:hypothetical protein
MAVFPCALTFDVTEASADDPIATLRVTEQREAADSDVIASGRVRLCLRANTDQIPAGRVLARAETREYTKAGA